MFSEPDDPAVRDRTHTALATAANQLGCALLPNTADAWGTEARTLGAPVRDGHARSWLRVVEVPEHKRGGKPWTGTAQAAESIPASIPGPGFFAPRSGPAGPTPTAPNSPHLHSRPSLLALASLTVAPSPVGREPGRIRASNQTGALPSWLGDQGCGVGVTPQKSHCAHGGT